jgi:hypothetical protein
VSGDEKSGPIIHDLAQRFLGDRLGRDDVDLHTSDNGGLVAKPMVVAGEDLDGGRAAIVGHHVDVDRRPMAMLHGRQANGHTDAADDGHRRHALGRKRSQRGEQPGERPGHHDQGSMVSRARQGLLPPASSTARGSRDPGQRHWRGRAPRRRGVSAASRR